MGEHKRQKQSEYLARLPRELREAVSYGGWMAAIYCAYAVFVYLMRGPAAFARLDTSFVSALAAYLFAGLPRGALIGFLYPLKRSLLGQFVLGILVAHLAFFGIIVATSGLPTRWTVFDWERLVALGLMFGIAGPLALRVR